MKQITWREGQFKYRPALVAYVNNVKVGAVSWLPNQESAFNAHCQLPNLKQDCSRYPNSGLAKEAVEKSINKWFDMVNQ
jgi:hypothetical protein